LLACDENCLTEEVRKAAGVEDAPTPYALPSAEPELRGVDRSTPVYFADAVPPQEAAKVA
jgi:hypothetical protein